MGTATMAHQQSFNAFEMAQRQFDRVADILDLDQSTRELLRVPQREYHVSIPVRMDDGNVKVFRGFGSSTTMPAALRKAASGSTRRRRSTRCAPSRCG
jgi:hypothetical protein